LSLPVWQLHREGRRGAPPRCLRTRIHAPNTSPFAAMDDDMDRRDGAGAAHASNGRTQPLMIFLLRA
jgi:hypothetical protein